MSQPCRAGKLPAFCEWMGNEAMTTTITRALLLWLLLALQPAAAEESAESTRGTLDWMGFYYKNPMSKAGEAAENDLFRQHARLLEQLNSWVG